MIFCNCLLVIFSFLSLLCNYFLIKNERTYYLHKKIINAIYDYSVYKRNFDGFIHGTADVTIEDMEDYDKTLYRFWDWGYGRILPAEKLKLIEPFIEMKGESK